MKLKRPLRGGEQGGDVVAVERALRRWTNGTHRADGYFSVYDRDRVQAFQLAEKIRPATGWVGQATLDALRPHMDAYAKLRYRSALVVPQRKVPNLGPIVKGGRSLLDYDLTHPTGGLAGYPALDGPFGVQVMIAPEDLTITRLSSARRRDGSPNGKAFYATGKSGLRYWIGHVEDVPAVGQKVKKGKPLCIVSGNHESPHGHVGIDASLVLGRELAHNTDYTHGAPSIRVQLARS